MAGGWFETVAIARKRAEKRVPPLVHKAILGGAEGGVTLRDNVESFDELGFAPKVADLAGSRDLATTVMGQHLSLPVMISPTGVQAVNPEGEVAVARAAAARGTAMGLSSFGSRSIEDVVAANPQTFFQVYWCGSRDDILQRLDRAKRAGAVGLIVTLDWSFSHGRDWGSPTIPEKLDLKTMVKMSPQAMVRPRWLLEWARTMQLPDLTVPNMTSPGEPAKTFFQAYGEWMGTPPPTWEDLRWLLEQWDGPVMIKGIIRIDDARRAVDIGATAISVSNHGGNNLDTTPASIRALAPIADAVGDQIEIVIDGGIRRGSDVVKAIALGARAAMLGRAYLWGLAANGQAGVENVLDIFRNGIDSTLRGLGRSSIHELTRDDIVVPDGFVRRLGAGSESP
jgi:heme/flavin dehydrogenase (mycofactocin system)